MKPGEGGKLVVHCPVCKRPVVWEQNLHRPFCSERCRLVDLGRWLDESYRISSPLDDESDPTGETQEP
ncbi:MAG: DNA gyrase inhibitor YacG [Thermodesulfobacteriota bacterium]